MSHKNVPFDTQARREAHAGIDDLTSRQRFDVLVWVGSVLRQTYFSSIWRNFNTTSSLQGQNLLLNKGEFLRSCILLGGKLRPRSLYPGWKVETDFLFLSSADSASNCPNTHGGLLPIGVTEGVLMLLFLILIPLKWGLIVTEKFICLNILQGFQRVLRVTWWLEVNWSALKLAAFPSS